MPAETDIYTNTTPRKSESSWGRLPAFFKKVVNIIKLNIVLWYLIWYTNDLKKPQTFLKQQHTKIATCSHDYGFCFNLWKPSDICKRVPDHFQSDTLLVWVWTRFGLDNYVWNPQRFKRIKLSLLLGINQDWVLIASPFCSTSIFISYRKTDPGI